MERIPISHQLSPSSWNRFEECPRKYWLSRQRLPRRASMPASLGNAIHNSMEEICNLDVTDRDDLETEWLSKSMKEILDKHWKIEKKLFLETPRKPQWKPHLISKAREGFIGALNILFTRISLDKKKFSEVSIRDWKNLQSILLLNEGSLASEDGKLIGRLDLLVDDLDVNGKSKGWIVADLKTGKPPKKDLNERVVRQLLFYRDLLKETTPEHPLVTAEGWYSANTEVYSADGESVLDDARTAWEMMKLTKSPFLGTPGPNVCGFCEFKAWCPDWWVARNNGQLSDSTMFRDEVVKLIRFDETSGAALFERQIAAGDEGEVTESEIRFGGFLKDSAFEQISDLISSEYDGPIYLGSARAEGKIIHLGYWSEVLKWSPLLESIRVN
ncbi:MAG: hypothetical protein HOE00_05465 [Euryarchaeota archaeon]|jgi:CRISPR/Cas system-associated exonuclease Cas4 (RecB family)|nr:hypothetical protein [Euryarchaeota archaeon]MBT3846517.1 hypothetical protein [Euryarchaeota archaeon]MBT4155932.1 hypothetical protein [Euryarchaeota archaeon]MBT4181029.1 hypothetical protein [Euryarchaeota archaeon]MBT4475491.1 hypothetical protein [Euryarchaeota archaeon]